MKLDLNLREPCLSFASPLSHTGWQTERLQISLRLQEGERMPDEAMTPDAIWQGDLFDRKTEAEQLIAYIESVVARPAVREDKRAYTIAIDAPYGEGKTFFLRRLSDHLAINHPVAFVDAWADDLADEPLTALAATLKQALEPFVDQPAVQDRLKTFMAKSSRVARIAGWGLFKRGVGLALTAGAVDEAGDVISGVDKDVQDAMNEGLREAVTGQVGEVEQAIRGVTSHKLMEERVATFEAGKAAISEMKASLEAIVRSLDGQASHPPIIIVIDELDRCRPTYAVKLLEEIKHLFDVPGLVFILALHSGQLAHSVGGAYGPGFDGRAYLRRFIDREYRLATPPLERLVEKLCSGAGFREGVFQWPSMVVSKSGSLSPSLAQLIAEYMKVYGLGARDAFQLIDILQTAMALPNHQGFYLPYLLPLAIGALRGLPAGSLPSPTAESGWVYMPNWSHRNSDATEFTFDQIARSIQEMMKVDSSVIYERFRSEETTDHIVSLLMNERTSRGGQQPLWSIYGYTRLLQTIRRFHNPRLDQ